MTRPSVHRVHGYPSAENAALPTGLTRRLPPVAQVFLENAVRRQLLAPSAVEPFLADRIDRLREYHTEERIGQALVQARLLTSYQLDRLLRGDTHGLILGSYRVLRELGRGGMGVVYLAEHHLLKRRVAVKVLPVDETCPLSVRQRFYAEMRVLAELSDPHIVTALDAGETPSPGSDVPDLIYLVLELIDGGDLEKHIQTRGPCEIAQGCNFIRQAALGLQAAHDRHLIHRDVKPSNLLLANGNRIKLVDFGLARQFSSRLTDQQVLLGSVDFMPPEQSHDPSAVGKEADIYGLGATLFWLLTGEGPYPYTPHVGIALRALQQNAPRRLRTMRRDVPPALDDLVAAMLARNPADRPTSPLAVANALAPFAHSSNPTSTPSNRNDQAPTKLALVVTQEVADFTAYHTELSLLGHSCIFTRDIPRARNAQPSDLVVLDGRLLRDPGFRAELFEALHRLRQTTCNPNMKILHVGPRDETLSDIDEWLPEGLTAPDIRQRLVTALRLKQAEDTAADLTEQLRLVNESQERGLVARRADVHEAHNALLFAMAKMAEEGDGETPGHLRRMQLYALTLAKEVASRVPWTGLVDERFLTQLERCVPLHDIGKIGLPDDVLTKPASLSPSERMLVETHPVIGDRILESLATEHGNGLDFLGMARVIVRHHHERHDGKGYPDRLAGGAIPHAARIVAICDVYDALRRMRLYKPALPHEPTVRTILHGSPGQFDPVLLEAFEKCHSTFERIYREIGD
jgi:response regulator RpfG family c-di-GMP phosphodiesterase